MLTHDWADEPTDDEPTDDYAQALAEDGYSLRQQRRIVRGEAA
ncbi:hypothetical protein ACFSJS_22750 [Streptomyces desertarenae]|uniref:Uncharacterized protein n=1 Tax=Streptomyces desertarenae TaxID=2666184 RepID=A0ABW4PSG5_9ACTN